MVLFTSEEKQLVTGAFIAGIADAALESYYNFRAGEGYDIKQHPEDPLYYFYYSFGNAWIPGMDDLIPLLILPLGLYYYGKMRKNARFRNLGVGAAIYGFSELIGWFAYKVARVASGQPLYVTVSQQYTR